MSKILITLDYELFFGQNSGSQHKCIIEPTNHLLELFDKYNVKVSFFVDSGYIIKLQQYKNQYPFLEKDYQELKKQIILLSSKGHDIQLHIHPHWEDSYFDGNNWNMITKRYRLHDFSENEINNIVYEYKKVLEECTNQKIFSFRAGGWCIQPFNKLEKSLRENNIWLDSTVFNNGKNKSNSHYFNFINAPKKNFWRFKDNPLKENKKGDFFEMPISSIKVSPLFFWKLALTRKLGKKRHTNFGDGSSTGKSKRELIRMLLLPSDTVASIDGYKIKLINKAFRQNRKWYGNDGYFVLIGHPKVQTPYSLKKLEEFIKTNKEHAFITYSDISNKLDS